MVDLWRLSSRHLPLLLELLLFLSQRQHDVGTFLWEAPDKVIVAGQIIAEVAHEVLFDAYVEW